MVKNYVLYSFANFVTNLMALISNDGGRVFKYVLYLSACSEKRKETQSLINFCYDEVVEAIRSQKGQVILLNADDGPYQ